MIEALVAIVVVALVLPIALAAVSASTRGAGQIQRRAIALRLAESHLVQVLADGTWSSSAQSGTFDATVDGEDSAAFRWRLTVEPWRDATVKTITLTVAPTTTEADDGPGAITLTTMAVAP